MSPSQDPSPPTSGRTHRLHRGVAMPPMLWILVASGVLLLMGELIALLSANSTALWFWQTVVLPLGTFGLFSIAAIHGALMARGHPWTAATRQLLAQRFNHPRLVAQAQMWAGILVLGWLSMMLLLRFPTSLAPITYAVFLAGFGPLWAFVLFDRRR